MEEEISRKVAKSLRRFLTEGNARRASAPSQQEGSEEDKKISHRGQRIQRF